ncbi:hypothetical protein GCM10008959_37220 [Deinococcus seoulensis]|uniref:DUF1684 domain-containing protein n=1 Tax=Deinococcus seoulensis TaxID=1837379 RepID=A0ABQ2RYK1_9DEIO|nr:DUF1684 domain-containing protein [Deinococcus seoulensis]GGR72261.1 hypothetical protein GCM10008959_37220 [Deinococcus seoulensis]
MTDPTPPASWLDLLDWRRELNDLYAHLREECPRDPLAAHRHWQARRNALFRDHPQSPLPADERAAFAGLPVWAYDPALRFDAPVDTTLPPEQLTVASSTGQDMPLVRIGRVNLPLPGTTGSALDVYWIDVYGGGVFVPFRDATSGHETYGGGRYLLDTAKGADLGSVRAGHLTLDFNFAYHPSCHYDPRWSCPLAPPQNVLGAAVRAGERSR